MNAPEETVQIKRNLCTYTGSKYRCAGGWSRQTQAGCLHARIGESGRCIYADSHGTYMGCTLDEAHKTAYRWGSEVLIDN